MSTEPKRKSSLRYLVPNALTGASMMFGLVSLTSAANGNYALAGWMILYAVLFDRLDGLVARALKATSQLGMQLDSFADFLNFGVAPAALVYRFLTTRADLPFAAHGWQWIALTGASGFWVLCAVFRLARYNITADDAMPTKIFFGVPSTLAGGLVATWFLALYKYDVVAPVFGGPRVLSECRTPSAIWLYAPIALALGAFAMVSSLPMPKGAISANWAFRGFVAGGMLFGYVAGFAQTLPEILVIFPTAWVVMFLIWGQLSKEARSLTAPPWFAEK